MHGVKALSNEKNQQTAKAEEIKSKRILLKIISVVKINPPVQAGLVFYPQVIPPDITMDLSVFMQKFYGPA